MRQIPVKPSTSALKEPDSSGSSTSSSESSESDDEETPLPVYGTQIIRNSPSITKAGNYL